MTRQVERYPVKSMRDESLPAAVLTLQGIPVDRRYAFVQRSSRSSFPWLAARELPELLRYHTSVDKTQPQEVELTVTTPSGEKFPINSDELRKILEARSGRTFFLLHEFRGSFDVVPISLISRQTITRSSKYVNCREPTTL